MSLKEVHITTEVFYACASHALTTEKEEVMGLLLGNIENLKQGGQKATIWDLCTFTRSDKRKDRVEVSPEHLVAATEEADKLSEKGLKTRVIGWYHSHPHITPWPSHVDLMCQGNYQLMEKGFVGLIFSVFDDDNDLSGKIQLHCFQSREGSSEMKDYDSSSSTDTEDIMKDIDKDVKMKETNFSPVKKSEFVRTAVPVYVIPCKEYPSVGLERIIKLQEILLLEEKTAFLDSFSTEGDARKKADKKQKHSGNPFPIIHNSAIFQKNVVKLLEFFVVPLKTILEQEYAYNQTQLKNLEHEEKKLLAALKKKKKAKK